MQTSVLIVDDQQFVLTLLSAILRGKGYKVHSAGSGQEALQIIRKQVIDILVTDYSMPLMNGVQLARQCLLRNPEMYVLYISGDQPNDELSGELAEPNRRFLAKPFRAVELLAAVKEFAAVSARLQAAEV